MSETVVVTATTGAVLHTPAGQLPLSAHFTYALNDPVAVSMTLVAEFEGLCGDVFTEQSTWVFARDLIDTAMSTFVHTGDGDVGIAFMAIEDVLRFELTDVHGAKHALFVDAEPIVDFMAETFAVAPARDEIVDVDDAIERLLDGSWES